MFNALNSIHQWSVAKNLCWTSKLLLTGEIVLYSVWHWSVLMRLLDQKSLQSRLNLWDPKIVCQRWRWERCRRPVINLSVLFRITSRKSLSISSLQKCSSNSDIVCHRPPCFSVHPIFWPCRNLVILGGSSAVCFAYSQILLIFWISCHRNFAALA